MPQSNNISLLELSAHFLGSGADGVLQRFPEEQDFLIVLPEGHEPSSLQWTSGSSINIGPNTTICTPKAKDLGPYANPKNIVAPINKRGRNSLETVLVGRDESADIRFTNPAVSKSHAKFKKSKERLLLIDHHSTNGTYINDFKLMPGSIGEITSGQELKFGVVQCVYLNLEHLIELVTLAAKR